MYDKMKTILVFTVLGFLSGLSSVYSYMEDVAIKEDIETLMKLILKDRIPERYRVFTEDYRWLGPMNKKGSRLTKFTWKDCGGQDDLIVIGNLAVAPDPVKLPGTITVSLAAKIKTNIIDPIEVQLTIRKKLGFVWLEIPCVDNVGSCTYTSICTMLANVTCPDPVVKIGQNCRCPITKSDGFNLPPSGFPISGGATIPTGDYEIEANVTQNKTVPVLCLNIMFTVEH